MRRVGRSMVLMTSVERARLAEKGRILYRKSCGMFGKKTCARVSPCFTSGEVHPWLPTTCLRTSMLRSRCYGAMIRTVDCRTPKSSPPASDAIYGPHGPTDRTSPARSRIERVVYSTAIAIKDLFLMISRFFVDLLQHAPGPSCELVGPELNRVGDSFHDMRCEDMQYYTRASKSGSVRWKQFPLPLIVVESPDSRDMVGIATEVGVTDNWRALWALRVKGADVPGLFVLVDGRFEPTVTEAARDRFACPPQKPCETNAPPPT